MNTNVLPLKFPSQLSSATGCCEFIGTYVCIRRGFGIFTVHDIDEIYGTAAWAGAGNCGREPSNCARGISIELATGVRMR